MKMGIKVWMTLTYKVCRVLQKSNEHISAAFTECVQCEGQGGS